MIIVKNVDQFNNDNVYFCEPIKNNIMNNGHFIRILYSTPLFNLNGIYLFITINHHSIEKYYNKYKCSFDIHVYQNIIEKLKYIEDDILKKVGIKGKVPQYKLYEQMQNGNIKIIADNIDKLNNTFLLKIAGIWETETEYGLTYKFNKLST